MLLFKPKYIILSAIITTLAILSIVKFTSISWGILSFLIYLIYFGFFAGQIFLPLEKRFWKIIFGSIAVLGLLIIILTPIYWFYLINQATIYFALIFIPFLIALQKVEEENPFAEVEINIDLEAYIQLKSHLGTKILVGIALFLDLLLLLTLWQRQAIDTPISPWSLVGARFLIIFLISTFLILWVLQKSKDSASNLLLIMTHSTLILSVVLVAFAFGFGFDPFIHQAAEKWITQYGYILPKQPYYIGQYVLVVASYFITHLPIDIIDRVLVPIGAGIFIPLFAYFSFSRTDYKDKLFPVLLLIPLLPLTFFIFTTPNNLALLLTALIIFWIWYENKNASRHTHLFGLILVLSTCFIHPFLGLPILIIYIFSILNHFITTRTDALQCVSTSPEHQTTKSFNHPIIKSFIKTLSAFYFLILTFTLPLTFYLNSLRSNQKITLTNPLANLKLFLNLFARPYYYWIDKGNIAWKTLYYYRDFLKLFIFIAILAGLFIAYKKYQEKNLCFYIITAAALFASAFFLSTLFIFPDVIGYEQNVYAERVLELWQIFLLPFFIIALRELFIFIRRQPFKQFLIALLFSGLLLISWYFTYPTRDPISFYTGYNVRQADIDAVHFINNINNGQTNYLVLTNQTVASAALREFGFLKYFPTSAGEQYFYSIPTGGPFYQYFRKMVYEEPKRQWMEDAMKFAGVKKAYFVHTNYWAPAGEIRDKAKLEANNWWELGNGRVWVFEYLVND